MGRAKDDSKREHAFLLYMQRVNQKEISDRVNCSPTSITNWIKKEGWKEKRAAATITRPELINKLLVRLNDLIEDPEKSNSLADQAIKIANAIEKLDKKSNVVDYMESFTDFIKYLQLHQNTDKELSSKFIAQVNAYQDQFITEKLSE